MNQQAKIQQRKLDGQETIHYTVANNLRRIETIDGQNMAPSMAHLAIEMMGAKKKHITLELFYLELSDKGICCQITPAIRKALFIGSFSAKSSTTPAPIGPFSCAVCHSHALVSKTSIHP